MVALVDVKPPLCLLTTRWRPWGPTTKRHCISDKNKGQAPSHCDSGAAICLGQHTRLSKRSPNLRPTSCPCFCGHAMPHGMPCMHMPNVVHDTSPSGTSDRRHQHLEACSATACHVWGLNKHVYQKYAQWLQPEGNCGCGQDRMGLPRTIRSPDPLSHSSESH